MTQVVHLRLVAKTPSPEQRDTINCLRSLLRKAERGEIIGITYAAMRENRDYFFSSCGEAHRNPGFANQMVSAMWYGTIKRVFREDE